MNATKTSASKQITLAVSGMTCAACQAHVQRALEKQPGVSRAAVNLMMHEAAVTFDPARASTESLIAVIKDTGYDAEVPTPIANLAEEQAEREREDHAQYSILRTKAVVSLVLGAVAMILSMPLMSGPAMHGTGHVMVADPVIAWTMRVIDPPLQGLMPWLYRMDANALRWTLLAITLLVVAWAGRHFYVRAWAALRHGNSDMNTLVAAGTGAALLFSTAATIAPGAFASRGVPPDVYFEAVVLIIAFVLTGNALESRAKKRTSSALRQLAGLQPVTATILRDGVPVELPFDRLRLGDVLLTRPGERIGADSEVIEGTSAVDESMITGESMPVEKIPGNLLTGGTLNRSGTLQSRVTRIGASSTLAQIVRMTRDAQASQAPVQRLADAVSRVFVPVVMAIAVVTFLAWMLLPAEPSLIRALTAAVAVLIIACPCAMGLAVPTAVMAATGNAAQRGVLIKGGEALERLARLDTVVFDKTGTLTVGQPRVVTFDALDKDRSDELLAMIAAVERLSEHPLAEAVVEYATVNAPAILPASNFRAVPGRGATATVNGRAIHAGNAAFLNDEGIDSGALASKADAIANAGQTPLLVALDRRAAAIFAVADEIKSDARGAVAALTSDGLRIIMLTGDRKATAQAIAAAAGITEVIAEVLPGEKAGAVRSLQREGRVVAMVGDGVNDAPALAQADSGIALASGADIARHAADVAIMNNRLDAVPWAIGHAKRALRIMHQNLFWAFIYNVIGIPIAAGVLFPAFGIQLSPVLASAAMALSSVSVVSNSLRLGRLRTEQPS